MQSVYIEVFSFLRRLAKSTLLLIPLFGVNYVVFVYIMEQDSHSVEEYKIFFDLCIGSFQVRIRITKLTLHRAVNFRMCYKKIYYQHSVKKKRLVRIQEHYCVSK